MSRVLGFFRDLGFALILGAGPVADTFLLALRLPNFFRRLFSEGALHAAFIPVYLEAERQNQAGRFLWVLLFYGTLFLLGLTSLLVLTLSPLLQGLSPGFDAAKHAETLWLGRWTLWLLPLLGGLGLLSATLNIYNRFGAAAFIPVLLNCVFLLVLGLCWFWEVEVRQAARFLAVSLPLAGLIQLVYVLSVLKGWFPGSRLDWRRSWAALWHPLRESGPFLRLFLTRLFPALAGTGSLQLMVFIDLILASLAGDGAVSWLYYADRLAQLPLGLIGVSLGVVLLPTLGRLVVQEDTSAFRQELSRGVSWGLGLGLPAMGGLFLTSELVIVCLFERGAFLPTDSWHTARALRAFALGVPAFILVKIFSSAYFARGAPRVVLRYGLGSVVVHLGLALVLFHGFGYVGIALATSLSQWFFALCLFVGLARQHLFAFQARPFLCHGGATLCMAGYLWILQTAFVPFVAWPLFWKLVWVLLSSCAVWGLCLGLLWVVLGVHRHPARRRP